MKKIIAIALLISPWCQANTDLKPQLDACRAIAEDAQRLACYDKLQASLSTLLKNKEKAEFGLNDKASQKDSEQEDQVATITEVKKSQRYGWIITLDNGQVWRKVDSNNLKVKVGKTVTISRAIFGSFALTQEGSSRRVKVKRLK